MLVIKKIKGDIIPLYINIIFSLGAITSFPLLISIIKIKNSFINSFIYSFLFSLFFKINIFSKILFNIISKSILFEKHSKFPFSIKSPFVILTRILAKTVSVSLNSLFLSFINAFKVFLNGLISLLSF